MYELKKLLQRANDSATDLDQVHYERLTDLPYSALSVLLKVYNHVWESGCFPPSWREAVVVPIPQPGKDFWEHGNFSLVALTNCFRKTIQGPPGLSRGTNSFHFVYSASFWCNQSTLFHHMFADDTELYKSDSHSEASTIARTIESCISDVEAG